MIKATCEVKSDSYLQFEHCGGQLIYFLVSRDEIELREDGGGVKQSRHQLLELSGDFRCFQVYFDKM